MTPVNSILVPAARRFDCVPWLPGALGATVLEHEVAVDAAGLRRAVGEKGPDLIVLSLRSPPEIDVRQALHGVDAPVLVTFEGCPDSRWDRFVVPVDSAGENHALAAAAELAADLGIPVIALHVANGRDTDVYADALHQEYAYQLDEYVACALPHCRTEARLSVVDSVLRRGDPAEQVERLVTETANGVAVLAADSPLLDALAMRARFPLLVVPLATDAAFRLHVGESFG